MQNATLHRQIDILSGDAEQRLEIEKREILAERARIKNAPLERRKMLASVERPTDGLLPTVMSLTAHERRNYSLQRLISSLAGSKEPGLEQEISASISKDIGSVPPHGGIWLPFRMSAGLDTRTNPAGDYLVATKVSANIADTLRAHTAVLRLGATLLSGLKYDFQAPVEDNILTANWISEDPGADCTQSDSSFQARMLRGHPMQATTAISRNLLKQSSVDMEVWLANRIAKAHATLLDKACIHGSGSSNQPVGILATAGIGSVLAGNGTDGGAVAASHLIALESAVADANGDAGALAFLTNSTQRAKLRKVPELASGTYPVWRDGRLLDYPAIASNQVSNTLAKGASSACSAILFGDWNTLFVGEFGGAMELVIDQITKVRSGLVELTSYASYDMALTTPASMAAIVDAT